jgi:hypothetical protein
MTLPVNPGPDLPGPTPPVPPIDVPDLPPVESRMSLLDDGAISRIAVGGLPELDCATSSFPRILSEFSMIAGGAGACSTAPPLAAITATALLQAVWAA